jgi:hypothetical protein
MKNFYVFKQTNDKIELIGKSKNDFSSYIMNLDRVMEWQAYEIEEALNSGDAAEDNPIVIECLDNGNEWVVLYPDDGPIIYTQKEYESSESLVVEIDEDKIYFKAENLLNEAEKELIK